MKTALRHVVLAACLTASPAFAQSASEPLNLKLPPTDAPPSSVPAPASSTSTPEPGVYYGDTSGKLGSDVVAETEAADPCDDATYNQPQVHGSVSTGVMSAGRRGHGSWQGGEINLRQAFGNCDRPRGGVSISIGAETGRFHGR